MNVLDCVLSKLSVSALPIRREPRLLKNNATIQTCEERSKFKLSNASFGFASSETSADAVAISLFLTTYGVLTYRIVTSSLMISAYKLSTGLASLATLAATSFIPVRSQRSRPKTTKSGRRLSRQTVRPVPSFLVSTVYYL